MSKIVKGLGLVNRDDTLIRDYGRIRGHEYT